MANWYCYYNEKGEKTIVTGEQLMERAKSGEISPDTIIENEEGKKARAEKVKGLEFPDTPSIDGEEVVSPVTVGTYGAAPQPTEPIPPILDTQEAESTPEILPLAWEPLSPTPLWINPFMDTSQQHAVTNFIYTDTEGQKHKVHTDSKGQTHVIDYHYLRLLAQQGVITSNTPLEIEGGYKGYAGQVPNLFGDYSYGYANSINYQSSPCYYYNKNSEKIPLNDKDIKKLAESGIIQSDTCIETACGQIIYAKHVKGLVFGQEVG